MTPQDKTENRKRDVEQLAEKKQLTLLQEFVFFLRHNKKWWLVPLLLALAIYGLFLVLVLTGGIASIYTLF